MTAVSFDARPYLDRKFSALAAHRSAFGLTLEMLNNPPPGAAQMLQAFRPVLEREVFLLGGARGPVPRWPGEDRFWLYDDDRRSPSLPHSRQPDPEQSVGSGERYATGACPVQDLELMSQRENLELQSGSLTNR